LSLLKGSRTGFEIAEEWRFDTTTRAPHTVRTMATPTQWQQDVAARLGLGRLADVEQIQGLTSKGPEDNPLFKFSTLTSAFSVKIHATWDEMERAWQPVLRRQLATPIAFERHCASARPSVPMARPIEAPGSADTLVEMDIPNMNGGPFLVQCHQWIDGQMLMNFGGFQGPAMVLMITPARAQGYGYLVGALYMAAMTYENLHPGAQTNGRDDSAYQEARRPLNNGASFQHLTAQLEMTFPRLVENGTTKLLSEHASALDQLASELDDKNPAHWGLVHGDVAKNTIVDSSDRSHVFDFEKLVRCHLPTFVLETSRWLLAHQPNGQWTSTLKSFLQGVADAGVQLDALTQAVGSRRAVAHLERLRISLGRENATELHTRRVLKTLLPEAVEMLSFKPAKSPFAAALTSALAEVNGASITRDPLAGPNSGRTH
jgi:hypothetical protein